MADWHAMMVSLMWNVQAWRDWIQEYINRALNYKYEPSASPCKYHFMVKVKEKNAPTLT